MNITLETKATFDNDGRLTNILVTGTFDGVDDKNPLNERRRVTEAKVEWTHYADMEAPVIHGPHYEGHSIKVNGERRGWMMNLVTGFAKRHPVEANEVESALYERMQVVHSALIGRVAEAIEVAAR